MDGSLLAGSTIDNDLDQQGILNAAIEAIKGPLNSTVKKGSLVELFLSYDNGFMQVVRKGSDVLIGILGTDGKTAAGLLKRAMTKIIADE
jgi:hypothetical protein